MCGKYYIENQTLNVTNNENELTEIPFVDPEDIGRPWYYFYHNPVVTYDTLYEDDPNENYFNYESDDEELPEIILDPEVAYYKHS